MSLNIQEISASIDWKALGVEIFSLLKDETKDLWKKEDNVYLRDLANVIIQEKALIMSATTDKQREEHTRNLLHLAAQVQSEIVIRGLKLQDKAQDTFIRVIGAVIRTVIVAAFSKIRLE